MGMKFVNGQWIDSATGKPISTLVGGAPGSVRGVKEGLGAGQVGYDSQRNAANQAIGSGRTGSLGPVTSGRPGPASAGNINPLTGRPDPYHGMEPHRGDMEMGPSYWRDVYQKDPGLLPQLLDKSGLDAEQFFRAIGIPNPNAGGSVAGPQSASNTGQETMGPGPASAAGGSRPPSNPSGPMPASSRPGQSIMPGFGGQGVESRRRRPGFGNFNRGTSRATFGR